MIGDNGCYREGGFTVQRELLEAVALQCDPVSGNEPFGLRQLAEPELDCDLESTYG